ncbi:MAG: hypothetical protein WAP51_01975 [Candidatus Sungiibacteriota bacterium]
MARPKVCVLLPCNPGAFHGNYNLGQNWKMVKSWLRPLENLADFEFAAMDCIAVELGRDAIVREREMRVVKGRDVYPNDSKITQPELAFAVMKGWRKFEPYDLVLVWLNVKRYREAFLVAHDLHRQPGKFKIFDRRGRYYRIGWGIRRFQAFARRALKDFKPC